MFSSRKSIYLCILSLFICIAAAVWNASASAVLLEGSFFRLHTVQPGDIVDGMVTLRNISSNPETVRFFLLDRLNDARYGRRYMEPAELERSNAPWIDLGQREVTIAPGQQFNLIYRIQVPDDESLSGTYWSALMIEPQPAEQEVNVEDSESDKSFTVMIQHVIRQEVMLVTNIGSSGSRQVNFLEPQLRTSDDGTLIFEVLVENKGERLLNPNIWLELYDESGRVVGRFQNDQPRIYPGAALRQSFGLGSLKVGTYLALVIVDEGGEDVFGARYTLQVTND